MQNGSATVEKSLVVPQKLIIEVLYDLTILLLDLYSK